MPRGRFVEKAQAIRPFVWEMLNWRLGWFSDFPERLGLPFGAMANVHWGGAISGQ